MTNYFPISSKIIPKIIKIIPKTFIKLTESPNTQTPRQNVHVAPIPVQIAYATPIGISFCAIYKNTPLNAMATIANIIQPNLFAPKDAIFIPNGQPTSNIDAIIKYNQLTFKF